MIHTSDNCVIQDSIRVKQSQPAACVGGTHDCDGFCILCYPRRTATPQAGGVVADHVKCQEHMVACMLVCRTTILDHAVTHSQIFQGREGLEDKLWQRFQTVVVEVPGSGRNRDTRKSLSRLRPRRLS